MGFETRVLNTVQEVAPHSDASFSNNVLAVSNISADVATEIEDALCKFVLGLVTWRYDARNSEFKFTFH